MNRSTRTKRSERRRQVARYFLKGRPGLYLCALCVSVVPSFGLVLARRIKFKPQRHRVHREMFRTSYSSHTADSWFLPSLVPAAGRAGYDSDWNALIAQRRDVAAPKGRLCARRNSVAESDASKNRVKVCGDLRSIFAGSRVFPQQHWSVRCKSWCGGKKQRAWKVIGQIARSEKICTKAQ